MKKNKHPIVTGLATGAVVGTATYMMANKATSQTKSMKRTAGKALRTVGSLMEDVSSAMK